mmetsp:Transcript_75850/g.232182  ORF Transcript_75850/g.232182 Transcript_75850/m.232182 type:complete len:354 (-) Transcript_75850:866-1927(-)
MTAPSFSTLSRETRQSTRGFRSGSPLARASSRRRMHSCDKERTAADSFSSRLWKKALERRMCSMIMVPCPGLSMEVKPSTTDVQTSANRLCLACCSSRSDIADTRPGPKARSVTTIVNSGAHAWSFGLASSPLLRRIMAISSQYISACLGGTARLGTRVCSVAPSFLGWPRDSRIKACASSRQNGSFEAARTSSRNASCKGNLGTLKMPVGSMFCPWNIRQPCSPAHSCASSASSVFPHPPGPVMNSTPDLLSKPFSARLRPGVAGHPFHVARGELTACGPSARARRRPAKCHAWIFCSFPFRVSSPPSVNSSTFDAESFVSVSTSTPFNDALPMSLADKFTTSPRTVYSRRD